MSTCGLLFVLTPAVFTLPRECRRFSELRVAVCGVWWDSWSSSAKLRATSGGAIRRRHRAPETAARTGTPRLRDGGEDRDIVSSPFATASTRRTLTTESGHWADSSLVSSAAPESMHNG